MSCSGRRIVRNTLVFGLRMTLRYKFIIFGFILGLSLMFSISIPFEYSDENIANLVQKNKLRESGEPVRQLRIIMSKDVSDVLEYAEKENKIVENILSKEGGERDLLALGQQPGKFGDISEIGDAQNKIKNLEEMINNLEQKKKELSLNVKKKKKKRKKGKESHDKPFAKPSAVNETNSMQKDEKKKEKTKSNCTAYDDDANVPRTVIPFMLGNASVSKSDVTFATHLSITRLDMLEEVMKRWSGPLSVALLSTPDTAAQLTTALHRIRAFFQGRVDLHVVGSSGTYYPANFLRNVALNNTRTDYVFLSDADFIPMYGIHSHIQKAIWNGLLDDPKTKRTLVVPAFEFPKSGPTFPKTKQDLINLWNKEKAFPFHYKLKPAHGPTDFNKWKNASDPYIIKWKQYFEPYVVMKTSETPRYHEGFVGREFNKISQLMEVQARGFQFMVLPNTFTIHLPHKKSGTTRTNYKCAVRLYRIFQKHLRKKYHANV